VVVESFSLSSSHQRRFIAHQPTAFQKPSLDAPAIYHCPAPATPSLPPTMESTSATNALAVVVSGNAEVAKHAAPPVAPRKLQPLVSVWAKPEVVDEATAAAFLAALAVAASLYPKSRRPQDLRLNARALELALQDTAFVKLSFKARYTQYTAAAPFGCFLVSWVIRSGSYGLTWVIRSGSDGLNVSIAPRRGGGDSRRSTPTKSTA